ncbi:ArsR/SmtB family transcription factor [Acinetobacter baumannii]|uniref:ArsR/SmtB family transcription factor n=1 Tax=Acinetobacter baumannii TaxID=470 RepID=UPI00396C9101
MNPEQAVTSLSALAQSSRLKIFRLLVVAGDQGCTVGDIGKQLELPSATLSFHLKELSHSGLIEKKQQGRFVNYVANYSQMKSLIAFLSEQCCEGVEQDECTIDVEVCD